MSWQVIWAINIIFFRELKIVHFIEWTEPCTSRSIQWGWRAVGLPPGILEEQCSVVMQGCGPGLTDTLLFKRSQEHGDLCEISCLKKYSSPGWCGSLDWVLAWESKGHRFGLLIPSQGTCLRCGPAPQLGMCERKPIDVLLTHQCFSPSLSPSLTLSLKTKSLKRNLYSGLMSFMVSWWPQR